MNSEALFPFSPAGRRWPEGSDEGAAAPHSAVAGRSDRSLLSSLTPSSALTGIFSPLGRRGKLSSEAAQ